VFYSLQILVLGSSSITNPMDWRTNLTALKPYIQVLWETSALLPPTYMIQGAVDITKHYSLQIAAVNRDNTYDGISVHRVVG
jgi:hypothetical protein